MILAFSYVNTVLFVNITGGQVIWGLEGLHDEYYALFSLSGVVVMGSALLEPLMCDSTLINYGGHLVFDYSIPVATCAYYYYAKNHLKPRGSTSKNKEA